MQQVNSIQKIQWQSSFDVQKAISTSKFFTKVKLAMPTKLVLRALIDYWNPDSNNCFPSQKTLAEVCDLSKTSVERAIKELKNAGIILTSCKLGFSNHYALTNKFFSMIAKTDTKNNPPQKDGTPPPERRYPHPPKEGLTNNKTNKKQTDFFKKNFYNDGIVYKNPEQTKKELFEKRGTIGKPSEETKKELLKMGIKCNIT